MKRLAFLLLLALGPVFAEAPAAKPFPVCFPGQTMFLARLDAKQLLEQPIVRSIVGARLGDVDAFIQHVRTATGLDFGSVGAVWVGVLRKDHAVIVFEGSYDVNLIRRQVQNIDVAQIVQRPGVPLALVLPDNQNPGQMNLAALLDESKLVFGRPELVDEYLSAYLGQGEGLPAAFGEVAVEMGESEALIACLLLRLPPEEVRKNPWLGLFTHGLGELRLGEDVLFEVGLGLRNPDMREPAAKAIEGVCDLYRLLDADLRRLDPIPSMLLEGATVEADPELLVLRTSLPREFAERLLRQRFRVEVE